MCAKGPGELVIFLAVFVVIAGIRELVPALDDGSVDRQLRSTTGS